MTGDNPFSKLYGYGIQRARGGAAKEKPPVKQTAEAYAWSLRMEGFGGPIKRCMDDEQQAKDQLETQWLGFVNSDRFMCTTETVGEEADAGATPPSYVELLTCIQDAQLA